MITHWKELLYKCLNPKTNNYDVVHQAIVTLNQKEYEEYREPILQELYTHYLKTKTFENSLDETYFIYKYFALNNNTQALQHCLDILEKIGDNAFTVKILSYSNIDKSSSIIQGIIDRYLPIMVENDCYIIKVLEHELLKEEKIETLIQDIEKSEGKTLPNLSYLFNNPNISASQLDRVAFLLKARGSTSFSTWLHLALHPNLDITLIKNHLKISGLNIFMKRYSNNCIQIVERNKNKSNMHKTMLLDCLPCLAEYGLEVNALDMSIEVLEEDYFFNT